MAEIARDLPELQKLVRAGCKMKYIFFWKIDEDAGYLSQWYTSEFSVDDRRYANAEQFMMAEKARLFGDEAVRAQILSTRSPATIKSLGRKVHGFRDDVWCEHRFDIVVLGNRAKFEQNTALCGRLLDTGTRILVEASPRDRIWGIGLGAGDPRAENPLEWRGLNLLGFALVQVRAELAARRAV